MDKQMEENIGFVINTKRTNLHILGIPEVEEKEKGEEKLAEKNNH